MRERVIRWSVLICVLMLAGCGAKEDPGDDSSGGGSGAPGGAGNTAGISGGGSGASGGGGSTPVSTAGGGGASGNGGGGAGASGGASGAGSGAGGAGAGGDGAGGSMANANGFFSIPATCGAATPNAMPGNACPGTPPPALKLTEIATGLVGPTFALQAPGDPTRIYVLEQLGPVRVVKDGTLESAPLLDLRDIAGAAIDNSEIYSGYVENGLLGMVFHPQFETNKKFYLSYTKTGPLFAISEFTMGADNTVDVTTFRELGTFPQYPFSETSGGLPLGGPNATNHVGSMMEFGPDGCLYVSRGEGGGENDFMKTGQDTSDTESAILRIDLANWGTAPAGNLAGLVWSYGFRNPWRFSFDKVTGDMYIGDVGQDSGTGFEEINVEPRGVVGNNYGWWPTAGNADCTAPGGCRKPAVAYGITPNTNSVIGGYVYRGTAIPGLVGRYIWADWTERVIKSFVYKGENAGQPEICDEHPTGITVPTKVRSFGQSLDGEIYVVAGGPPSPSFGSAGNDEAGTLYRIDAM